MWSVVHIRYMSTPRGIQLAILQAAAADTCFELVITNEQALLFFKHVFKWGKKTMLSWIVT